MDATSRNLFLSQYCITVGLLCMALYMFGFFPLKSSPRKLSSSEDIPLTLKDLKFHKEKVYKGAVGKTVLMVIDGLRVDFVTADNMPYTAGRIANDRADSCQLTTRVSAPTVTLPRVKAIVTGGVSSFIDVVLNFGTMELKIDNIVEQASQTKTVVFYGDDTWIKLFPRQFTRSDGTSSFFVNDYTEVDNNVTRHLERELGSSEWELMVLHYLGLDHIGHIEGPRSRLIQPKLREMDDVIARLHSYLKQQDGGLLVVCGDHGMKDTGSHGGVSLPEVLVPLITLGLSCPDHYKSEIQQVDIAPTLSALWGAPIPRENAGVAVPALLSRLPPAQRLHAQLYNGRQLADTWLLTEHESYKLYEQAMEQHYEWLSNSSSVSHRQVEALYQEALTAMSRFVTGTMADYNMWAIFSSIALLLQVVCMLGLRLLGTLGPPAPRRRVALLLLTGVFASSLCSVWFTVHLVLAVLFLFNSVCLCLQLKSLPSLQKTVRSLGVGDGGWSWRMLLHLGTLLFCASLFSSSLIEEEHQLWYFLWVTVCCLRLREGITRWLTLLACHRVLRTVNQTGDQWAHLPDLSDWLTLPHNLWILSVVCMCSLAWLCWSCARLLRSRLCVLACVCCALCVYSHKAAVNQTATLWPSLSSDGVLEVRLCWLLLATLLLLDSTLAGLTVSCSLASCLLLRPHNTLLPPALLLYSRVLSTHSKAVTETVDLGASTVLHHWLGAVFFFYQGNSNSLASVDVAAGYIGLTEYNAVVVGALLSLHTYCMPVMAYLLNVHQVIIKARSARCPQVGSDRLRSLKLLKCSTVVIVRENSVGARNFTLNDPLIGRNWRLELTRSVELVTYLQLVHVTVCLVVVALQRYHLFVWTVFSPKLLYVGVQTFIFFLLVSITNGCTFLSSLLRTY